MPIRPGPPPARAPLDDGNARFYANPALVRGYVSRQLRPVEAVILGRYGADLRGRVLDVGCGAGRLVGHLLALSPTVHGIDISLAMVEYCRGAYPKASFSQLDMRDVATGETERDFDAIVASSNVLDALNHRDRGRTLRSFASVIAPGGLLIMSSHNRGFAMQVKGPIEEVVAQLRRRRTRALAASVVRLPRRLRNHRRLRGGEMAVPDFAVLNDIAHDYALLHVYVFRDDQERQLAEQGFDLVECLDLEGNGVEAGGRAPDCSELHYVARRASVT